MKGETGIAIRKGRQEVSEKVGMDAEGSVIRLGVSACLLGEEVRFDGGHKRNPFVVHTLSRYVEWVPVCPEVEFGMGIPREPVRLLGSADAPRLIAPRSGREYTEEMARWAKARAEALAGLDLHGYILKKDSPSCGLFWVRVYDPETGHPNRTDRGIFARALVEALPPLLPVEEEEERLNSMELRENFIERIFVYARWRRLLEEAPTPGGLVGFHTAHKMSMLAHSPRHYREMGRLVAQADALAWEELIAHYGRTMMEGLKVLSTPGKHAHVIHHLMGFLKDALTGEDKAELLELVESYWQRLVPLVVPLPLLKHHLNRHPVPAWARQQVYLNPYPKEVMLRNHV